MGSIMVRGKGFTVVELTIVIVVIAILATIIYAAYGGIQERSRMSRIAAEANTIKEAIETARVRTHQTLGDLTGNWWTGQYCLFQPTGAPNPGDPIPNGTDLSKKTTMTQKCWDDYASALQKISDASGVDITNFTDPFGRPYYIDENDDGSLACHYDSIVWLKYPYVGGWDQDWGKQELKVPTYDPRCYS